VYKHPIEVEGMKMDRIKFKDEVNPEYVMRTTPNEKAFYFFLDIGRYTGISARSLEEFYEKISIAPSKSLEFHLIRGDFEKWVREVLGDSRLADMIGSIDRSLKNKKLRAVLKMKIRRRINQLRALLEIRKNEYSNERD